VRDALLTAAGVGIITVVLGVPFVRSRRRATPEATPLAISVLRVLPGANCGACGNASCFDAAREVAAGRAPSNLCAVGGDATAWAVAELLNRYSLGQLG